MLRDPARLARILNDPERPVQIIYAGKAHPQDDLGKHLIRAIIEFGSRPELRRKIVFLENYDMATARCMLQGCDVWLNTPRRPLEASGTSGMKAQANGVLSVSTLDGWWDEAWELGRRTETEVGWAIGNGETYADLGQQDQVESEALYELLEREIIPTFYERRADGLPRKWIARMKASIAKLCPVFNMHRMVREYTSEYYRVAHERYTRLSAEGGVRAKNLAGWLARLEQAWPHLHVESIDGGVSEVALGYPMHVSPQVFLDTLGPDDVSVEIVAGRVNADSEITNFFTTPMQAAEQKEPGSYRFESMIQTGSRSGLYGYAIRVLPKHPDLVSAFLPGRILWACGDAGQTSAVPKEAARAAGRC